MDTYAEYDRRIEKLNYSAQRLLTLKEMGHGQGSTDQRIYADELAALYRWLTGRELREDVA